MINGVYVVGLAGAGKSWLTYTLYEWFKDRNRDVATLNLDPGATNLPYSPDIDIREYVNIWDVMERYQVGPNGGLILSMDLLVNYLDEIINKIRDFSPSLLLVDTPGQMEVFAYRAAGKLIMDLMPFDQDLIIYVQDGGFIKDPRNFISSLLIASSIKIRFEKPMLLVMNKLDLLTDEEVGKIFSWFKSPLKLHRDLDKLYPNFESSFLARVYTLMKEFGLYQDFISVSAMYLTNVETLIQAITRVFYGGEEEF